MKTAIRAAVAATCLANAPQVAAQSINPAFDAHQSETRVSAAITIPLGHSRDTRTTAPRFELITRTRAPDDILAIVARDEERRWQERRIGFTLDGSDELMLNGRPMAHAHKSANLDTTETILVVVGGVLVVGIVGVYALADGLSGDE